MTGPDAGTPSRSKFVLFLSVAVALFAVFCGLGIWQLQRLHWKLDLIARVEQRVHARPTALEAVVGLDPRDQEYRRVTVTGRFDNSRETLVKAVTERGGGFWVITPLRTDGGRIVLINRGFVPPEMRKPSTRMAGQINKETAVTGLVRISEPGGGFLRSNDPASDHWYSRDVPAIAAARHLESVESFFIDAERGAGYPVGGLTVVSFRNEHLAYALTWFGLALLCGYASWRLLRDRRRHNRNPDRGRGCTAG